MPGFIMLLIGLFIVAATVCLVMIFATLITTVLYLRQRKNKKSSDVAPSELTGEQHEGIWPPPPKF